MNERIRELARQAEFLENDLHIQGDNFQYFAELIVKECMSCSTWVGKMNTTAIEPIHTAHAINQRIQQHFGVEE